MLTSKERRHLCQLTDDLFKESLIDDVHWSSLKHLVLRKDPVVEAAYSLYRYHLHHSSFLAPDSLHSVHKTTGLILLTLPYDWHVDHCLGSKRLSQKACRTVSTRLTITKVGDEHMSVCAFCCSAMIIDPAIK